MRQALLRSRLDTRPVVQDTPAQLHSLPLSSQEANGFPHAALYAWLVPMV